MKRFDELLALGIPHLVRVEVQFVGNKGMVDSKLLIFLLGDVKSDIIRFGEEG